MAKIGLKIIILSVASVHCFLALANDAQGSCIQRSKQELRDYGLPASDTPDFQGFVSSIREQLRANNSFAILDLQRYIKAETGIRWFESLPNDVPSQIHSGNVLLSRNNIGESFAASKQQIEMIRNMQTWFRSLISEAVTLTTELSEGNSNVRLITGGGEGLKFDEWHIDGGNISVTVALHGVGTETLGGAPLGLKKEQYHSLRGEKLELLCSDCSPHTLPQGYALILFGSDAGISNIMKPTIHRTPRIVGERVLQVIRF